MTVSHPFLRQIDHVGIHADDPESLFRFFTETLDLPVAFPFNRYPNYISGSVVLGNMFLELMRFGSAGNHRSARYLILGFLNGADTLAHSLRELDRRGIPHSGVSPFFAPEATDENPVKLWSNVFLGDLLGTNVWMRLLFWMTKQSDPTPSLQRSPLIGKITMFIFARAFRSGMPVITEYYRENDEEKWAADRAALQNRDGGALGVQHVREIVVGTPAAGVGDAHWTRLLAPITADEDGLYRLGGGPAIRLVPDSQARIKTMVLQVQSLDRARLGLQDAGLAHEEYDGHVTLVLPHTGNLPIQLREGE